ncbi:MAG: prepilin-type N-terminal cleavage/methylation domain-containing protein [Sumerlaeia bacterium]
MKHLKIAVLNNFSDNRYSKNHGGFTLVELLMVVAIISLLALIGSANFLELQTRVKMTRVKSDHLSIQSGLEIRRIDSGNYPSAIPGVWPEELKGLATPISYLSQLPTDPFNAYDFYGQKWDFAGYDFIRFHQTEKPFPILFIEPWYNASVSSEYGLISSGPDLRQQLLYRPPGILNFSFYYTEYDPTNGTISDGDIYTFK